MLQCCLSSLFFLKIHFFSSLLQISAEEIKDNRVANFEVEARKLDNKVWVILKSEMLSFIFR